MREYPLNSPESAARIVGLALVADGRLDNSELAMLRRIGAYDRIGLTESRFVEVLNEFCTDLLSGCRPAGSAYCEVDREALLRLLGDLDDPARQKEVLNLILHVIRADGRLHPSESLLFWQAIERWRMRISDVCQAIPRRRYRIPGPARTRIPAMAA